MRPSTSDLSQEITEIQLLEAKRLLWNTNDPAIHMESILQSQAREFLLEHSEELMYSKNHFGVPSLSLMNRSIC